LQCYAGLMLSHGTWNGTQDPSGHCFFAPQHKQLGMVGLRFPIAPTGPGTSSRRPCHARLTGWGAPTMVKEK
jgi:hypothetical protein